MGIETGQAPRTFLICMPCQSIHLNLSFSTPVCRASVTCTGTGKYCKEWAQNWYSFLESQRVLTRLWLWLVGGKSRLTVERIKFGVVRKPNWNACFSIHVWKEQQSVIGRLFLPHWKPRQSLGLTRCFWVPCAVRSLRINRDLRCQWHRQLRRAASVTCEFSWTRRSANQ